MEIELDLIDFIHVAVLYFKKDLNPTALGEFYKELPGVNYVEPNYMIGDSSNIFPRQTDSGMTYLFYRGSGDCPSGCIYKDYWYFSCFNNNCSFIGRILSSDNSNKPYWWEEAEKNITLYRSW